MPVHVGEKHADVGETLPLVAGHLGKQRAFQVHDFIMRDGQNKILGEGVQHAKRNVRLMILAKNGVLFEVIEHVVHPAHIPFHGESKAVGVNRPGHGGPGSGLFGDGDCTWLLMRQLIEEANKIDRFQILAAAEFIGQPLARLTRIIAIKHRRNRVDAQAVDMKFPQPIESIG